LYRYVAADNATGPLAQLFFDTGFSATNLRASYVQSFYFLGGGLYKLNAVVTYTSSLKAPGFNP
jgi:hypothetical protein